MAALSIPLGTSEPIPFREHGCEGEFLARVRGSAEVSELPARFGSDEAAKAAFKKAVAALIPGCFARWPEGKLIMGSGNREILNGRLDLLELRPRRKHGQVLRRVRLSEAGRECAAAPG